MTRRTFLYFALLELLFCGCAGRKEARETARLLIGQSLSYEGELQSKVSAEETYYKDRFGSFTRSFRRYDEVNEPETMDRMCMDFSRQLITSGKTATEADLRDFLDQKLGQVRTNRQNAAVFESAETKKIVASIALLDSKLQALRDFRKGLEPLQKKLSASTEGKELVEFFKAVKKKYDDSKPTK